MEDFVFDFFVFVVGAAAVAVTVCVTGTIGRKEEQKEAGAEYDFNAM